MELHLGKAFMTFDGAVVESFGAGSTENGRIHVAVIDRVDVEETRRGHHIRFFSIWGGSPLLISFRAELRPQVEHFADEVRKVLAIRGRG